MAILIGGSVISCNNTSNSTQERSKKDMTEIIGRAKPTIQDGIITPEVLYSFGRIGEVQVSPDKSRFVYQITYVSVEQNKTNSELFVMNSDGSGKKQLTVTNNRESNPRWINNGKKIAFLGNETGSTQIWSMNPDGGGMTQISKVEGDISGFSISPDGEKVLFIKDVKIVETAVDRHSDLPQASGRIVDDLMYKHWDHWVETVPHPFVADLNGSSLANIRDIMEGEPYESPLAPFGGMEQLAWSPDSKTIAYTSRKKTGKEYAISTNSDIYFYDIETGESHNMTEGMMGYDVNPQFSPDGTLLAWQSMERDGYEADKNRLILKDLSTGVMTDLTESFDNNCDAFIWGEDNSTMYMVSSVEGTTQIYKVDVAKREISKITEGKHNYTSISLGGDGLIATRQSMSQPTEIYSVNLNSGYATELSYENEHILTQLQMGEVEERWIETTDNKQMLTWVVYPPNFNPDAKYPAILYCQGGPQSTLDQYWSYRWNLQIMAANGYIIVAPNRRGVPGFGSEWREQISGDYGGQNMLDYLSAIDELSKEPYVDENRLGATGASYGGFSVFWLAGNHNKRFKAFFAHAGIFNTEAQYLETEEMFFANWDMGGPYWDKSNAIAQNTYANSPHRFVDKWDTPIMISHGEYDYRILASQGMMAFNAAQLKGISSRLLIYPDENHWILKPQNGILFQREFFRWFDEWLK
ncbi:MAG TPA: S9 family peptidase [Fermentimonas sp.]|nr:S9 family peptidase [Fermentimonas sp.]